MNVKSREWIRLRAVQPRRGRWRILPTLRLPAMGPCCSGFCRPRCDALDR